MQLVHSKRQKLGMVVGAGLVCASMVGLLINARLHAAEELSQMTQPAAPYRNYVSSHAALPVSFEYPSEWSLQEEEGQIETYRQVRLKGRRNAADTYTAYVAVYAAPRKDQGGRFQTAGEFASHYQAHLARDAAIESSAPRTIADLAATEIVVSYTLTSWHHRDLSDVPIPLKVRTVFFEQGPLLFKLTHSVDAREYDQGAHAFDHLLDTLRIQEPG